jgi:hypothetical protein
MDRTYGNFGGPKRILEAYIAWRDETVALQEADSKADFASFLFGPIRQSMYAGYQRIQPQYRRYARIDSAQDFRETRIKGLNSLRGLGYVGDHGEYPEMRRTDRPSAAVVVDTYGGVYSITRQLIRNDDTNELLSRVPDDMGREAGRFVAEAVVALIESNPTAPDGVAFFHASRSNLGTAALSEDSLATAISNMESQLDDDGGHIIVTPRALVVQSARQQLVANRIINSQLTGAQLQYTGAAGAGTTIMDKGTLNPLNGIIPADGVVRDPYFTDANDWYLFADPGDIPAFTVAFLDGQESPFVGLKNPVVRSLLGPNEDPYEFDIDTLDYKCRLDFGIAAVDPRGAFRASVP